MLKLRDESIVLENQRAALTGFEQILRRHHLGAEVGNYMTVFKNFGNIYW